MTQQLDEAPGQRRRGRVVAGKEQEPQVREELLLGQGMALLVACREKEGKDIARRRRPPLRHQQPQPRVEPGFGSPGAPIAREGEVELQRIDGSREERVQQPVQVPDVLGGWSSVHTLVPPLTTILTPPLPISVTFGLDADHQCGGDTQRNGVGVVVESALSVRRPPSGD